MYFSDEEKEDEGSDVDDENYEDADDDTEEDHNGAIGRPAYDWAVQLAVHGIRLRGIRPSFITTNEQLQ